MAAASEDLARKEAEVVEVDDHTRREASKTDNPSSEAKLANATALCSLAPSPSNAAASATSNDDTEGVSVGGT